MKNGKAAPEEDGEEDSGGDASQKQQQQRVKRTTTRRRSKNKTVNGWKVGNKCAAYFTEDGLLYNAVIKSIDKDNFSCVVRYIGNFV